MDMLERVAYIIKFVVLIIFPPYSSIARKMDGRNNARIGMNFRIKRSCAGVYVRRSIGQFGTSVHVKTAKGDSSSSCRTNTFNLTPITMNRISGLR